jgi:hypothetical protein
VCIEKKYKLFNEHICICCGRAFVRLIIFTGGLLSAKSFLREGFCPPCHFNGRAFVRLVIFTGGLLSALLLFDERAFVREGFCPTLGYIGLPNFTVGGSPWLVTVTVLKWVPSSIPSCICY